MYLDKDTIEYAMSEACGSFAYTLSLLFPGGAIYILSSTDPSAEPWSEDIDYEITHVFYSLDGTLNPDSQLMDAKGIRSVNEMADDFFIRQYEVVGPFEPEEFKKEFMGEGDACPLYFDQDLVTSLLKK